MFIGPLVTELCRGLGLDEALAGERVEVEMTALSIGDLFSMGLRLGADYVSLEDAPEDDENEEEDYDEEDEDEEEEQRGGEDTQQDVPTMMDWESTRAFHLQLHHEYMTLLHSYRATV